MREALAPELPDEIAVAVAELGAAGRDGAAGQRRPAVAYPRNAQGSALGAAVGMQALGWVGPSTWPPRWPGRRAGHPGCCARARVTARLPSRATETAKPSCSSRRLTTVAN
jgi:hypothetical protein